MINKIISRAVNKYRRTVPRYVWKKTVPVKLRAPIISFSFDDAPHTAFISGRDILNAYGAKATYYVSLGMLNCDSPSGLLASLDDIQCALNSGHELGCHTYDHRHSWHTKPRVFLNSVRKNREALKEMLPGISFSSMSYPICAPRPASKRLVGQEFLCCRSGGQTLNVGETDLNMLNACFLDIKNRETLPEIKRLIDQNSRVNGWLIFATHDVDDDPSPYGCSKDYFEEVVRYASASGAKLLAVGKACEVVLKNI